MPSFESLSVPLDAVLSSKFEQPYFGANYLVLVIRPSLGGGLTDGTSIEIRFYDRGLFEFVSVLEKTRERVVYMRRQAMEEDENLRECPRSIDLSYCSSWRQQLRIHHLVPPLDPRLHMRILRLDMMLEHVTLPSIIPCIKHRRTLTWNVTNVICFCPAFQSSS